MYLFLFQYLSNWRVSPKNNENIKLSTITKPNSLMIFDDKEFTKENLGMISSNYIEAMNALKDEAYFAKYDDKSKTRL